ncbi:hypothetical protein QBC44DRAFT_397456 [Cladorrhinum sp. PSN332]|nr:hypothetical protein QBC44DRAFT_397456 [Cladorrhinum sp. PSN332]
MAGASLIGASCPEGGSFYVCQNNSTEFVGCCTSNPCTSEARGICSQNNLRPTSFSKDYYNSIPPQACVSKESPIDWYTCSDLRPPFMGCCKRDPCKFKLCPINDLAAAELSENPHSRQVFLGEIQTQSSTPSSTPTTTATSSSTQTLAATSQPAIPSSTPADTSNKSGGLPVGAIVGIAVGGVVILLALIIFGIICFRRRNAIRNNLASAGGNQITDHSIGGPPNHTAQAEYKSASTSNYPSGASQMSPQMYSPLPPSFQFDPSPPAPHHRSLYPSLLHSPPYDPLGNQTRVSHVSHLSEGSQRSGNTSYAAYQPPPSGFGNGPPHFAHMQPSPWNVDNARGYAGGGAPQYSELPVEELYQRREL